MRRVKYATYSAVAIAVLIFLAQKDYLIFHSLAELFSIVIAFGIFVIGWNSRKYYQNNYLLFIGIAYLYVAFFDTLHTLAYKGMGVFKGFDDNNLPPQLWLVARYIESISLLIAPYFLNRILPHRKVFWLFSGISLAALYAIFEARIFPTCFIQGIGLTPFKRFSEYLIDGILLCALYYLYKRKEYFETQVLRLLTLSILCTMITELCFTVYVHLYGISNLVGHIFKIASFLFMYKAVIETALTKPYDLLFKELSDQKDRTTEALDTNQKVIAESFAGMVAFQVATGNCIIANEAAACSVGTSTELLKSQNFRRIESWKQSGMLNAAEKVISTGASVRDRFELTTTFGKHIIIDGYFTLFASGGEQHLMLMFEDISERVRQEALLIERGEFIRNVINSLTAHIAVLDRSGIIIMVNEAWRQFARDNGGNESNSCEGSDYLTSCSAQDNDVQECRSKLMNVLQGHESEYRFEYDCTISSGEVRHFLMRAVPFRSGSGGAVISHYDITDRRRMELSLLQREKQYRSLFNGITEGFALHEIICDDSGDAVDYRFVDVNPAFERSTGLEREKLVGSTISQILPEEYVQWVARYAPVALQGDSIHFEDYSPALSRCFEVFAYQPAPLQFAVLCIDVTERNKLEAQIKNITAEQKIILDNASIGITFVKDRTQIWANPKMAEMFQYSLEEMENQSTRMFYPSDNAYERNGQLVYPVLERGEVFATEIEMMKKDGTIFWTRLSGKAVSADNYRAGSIWIIEDITESKRSRELLIQSRDRLNEAQRIAHIGNWEFDILENELFWSDEIYRIFEIDPSQFGASYESFLGAIHPDDRSFVDNAYRKSLQTRMPYAIKHRLLMSDGRIKHVYEQCETVFDDSGSALRSSGTVQDITDIEQARIAAETANRAKSMFLANMSHEIRTPLNGVIGMGQILRMTSLTSQQIECVDAIVQSGNNLLELINNILDLSKIEEGKIELDNRHFKLREVISEVSKIHSYGVLQKKLSYSFEIKDDVPDDLIGDALRYKQILINLLGNAIKFTESGGLFITVRLESRGKGQVQIETEIRDTGIGMSANVLKCVFEPFVQADTSITRRFGGTGLGLSICRKLAEKMGGSIRVESVEGVGSTFILRLPFEVSSPVLPDEMFTSSPETHSQKSTFHILLADDTAINRSLTGKMLSMLGHSFTSVTNGEEALEAISKDHFDLVLMDINMPIMDGEQALTTMRKSDCKSISQMPVIALTAYAFREEQERFMKSGFNGFVTKPLELERLAAGINQVMHLNNSKLNAGTDNADRS